MVFGFVFDICCLYLSMIEGGSHKLELIVPKKYLNPKLVQSPPPAADVWWVNNHFLRQVDKSIINPAGRASKESERIIFC